MFKVVLLLSAISCVLGAAVPKGLLPQLDGRIVGGEAVSIGLFPWQISLQRRGSHSCGGSIYSAQIIITAAHCLQSVSASALRVRAGSSYWNSGGVLINVAAVRAHEGFNVDTMAKDIAVIRLQSALPLGGNIRTIPLAHSAPESGSPAVISGWGTTSASEVLPPRQLRAVEVAILSNAACASSTYGYGSEIKPTMICSYSIGRDACQGDSGGPLVSGGVLVGVVSWGYGCANPDYPGVYADVAHLRHWVIRHAVSI